MNAYVRIIAILSLIWAVYWLCRLTFKLRIKVIGAIGSIAIAAFAFTEIYFQNRPLVYPSTVIASYDENTKVVTLNVSIENKGNSLGQAWIDYVLLSTDESVGITDAEKFLQGMVNNTDKC